MNPKIIEAPKHFTASSVIQFISNCQKVFALDGKRQSDYALDLSKVKKLSMLGVLITYKFIEYTAIHQCFHAPQILLDEDEENGKFILTEWDRYGFKDLILAYIEDRGQAESIYKKLKVLVAENFIIAPQALLRNDNYSSQTLKSTFLPKIEKYYANNPRGVSMIFTCLSEILLNFWEHAVDDTKSIIVASGNDQNIEIACADTGTGIVSSLKSTIEGKKTAPIILAKSVKRGITSKKNTNHMGYGLWILDELVKLTKGRMNIYSEGAYYHNERGKITSGECGYWQGTIIFLSLPLTNPKTLSDISNYEVDETIKINWV